MAVLLKILKIAQEEKMKFEEMIGKKWLEVKDEMISYIIVDKDNIDKKQGLVLQILLIVNFYLSMGLIKQKIMKL